jgi:tripartite-type tricarboxylate transporter receptor subunit TctC
MIAKSAIALAIMAVTSFFDAHAPASAQTYPMRPIALIVPYAPGGPTDVIGRVLAERMRGPLGQPIIIENVSGADGSIGVGRAARAKPDGYTIDLGALTTHVLNGAFYSLQYDVLNDFASLLALGGLPYALLARKNVPAKGLQQLVAWLNANPKKASAAVYSSGSRLVTVFFQKETGTRFSLVPYRGAAPAMQDVIAGQTDLLFGTPDQLAFARGGSLKAFAVTSDRRLELAPDTPTFAETLLPALSYSNWLGLFAPKGTPRDIIDKLNAAAAESLDDPAVRSRLGELGLEIFPRRERAPETLAALVKADAVKWWPIIKELGIKAE